MKERVAWNAWDVVYDEAQAMSEFGLEMTPGRHQIMPDGEWIRWARRTFGKPDLFVYRHGEHGTFVLAEWLRPPSLGRPICMELESMDWPPDWRPGQLTEGYLRDRLCACGDQVERMRSAVRDMAYAKREAKRLRGERKREAVRFMRKRGLELEAMCAEKGAVNLDYDEDEITERINGMLVEACRSRKVVSAG